MRDTGMVDISLGLTLRVIRNIPDYAAQANMDALDSFTLNFTLQAQTTPDAVRNPDIEAADMRVHFEEVFSSAIFTNFRLTIASDTLSNTELEQWDRAIPISGCNKKNGRSGH